MTNYNENCIFLIASIVRTQLKSCYFCAEVFIYEYLRTKNSNFLLQDFQQLNYLCRTTKTVLTSIFVILLQITGLNPVFIYV